MLGRSCNLLMQHTLYRALPHREGEGSPRDIVTGHYNRALVRGQLRKELRCIRNVDMFALLAEHVTLLHSRAATGATSTAVGRSERASATATAAPTAASSRSRNRS